MKLTGKEKVVLNSIIEDFIVENSDGTVQIGTDCPRAEWYCFKRDKLAKLLTDKFIHLYEQIEKVGLVC